MIYRLSVNSLLGVLVLLCACIVTVAIGVIGIGRSGGFSHSNIDMQFLYVAGIAWLKEEIVNVFSQKMSDENPDR